MKLTLTGEEAVHAPQDAVWGHLMDAQFVAACVPDVEEVEPDGDGGYRAVARLGLGRLRLRFKLRLTFDDLAPPEHGAFQVAAKAPGSKVDAVSRFRLAPEGEGTRVHWQIDASFRGTVAVTGARLLKPAASKAAAAFWDAFAERVHESRS